jgi:hypothetical protein
VKVVLVGGPHDGTAVEVPDGIQQTKQYTLQNRPVSARIALSRDAAQMVHEVVYAPHKAGQREFWFVSSNRLV